MDNLYVSGTEGVVVYYKSCAGETERLLSQSAALTLRKSLRSVGNFHYWESIGEKSLLTLTRSRKCITELSKYI